MKKHLSLFLLLIIVWSCNNDDDPNILKACFNYQFSNTNDGEVQFTNCSENASSFLWDFGDGEISNEKNPVHTYTSEPPYNVRLIASTRYQKDTVSVVLNIGRIEVYKPNIYIYTTTTINLCLKIEFPLGGEVIESIPEYENEWCVSVQPDGTIDNQYSYLFYESSQPDIFQYEKGWCVAKENLKSFFRNNMLQYNFSEQEIKDFTDYWVPRLTDNEYYLIYPQTNEIIDKAILLDFSLQPENTGRLFYAIAETNNAEVLTSPQIKPFERNGFYVMEWGVILK